jgi:hypothetical protein
MKSSIELKMLFYFIPLLLALSSFAKGDTHTSIQAVDADGYGVHPDLVTSNKVTVEGIILNRPDFMLDATPQEDAPFGAGAMWQIYIQGEGDDHAGTAIWMGQCYDNVWGSGTYTNEEWLNEIYRVSHDPVTGYEFAPGDRVRVTGLLKFYGGKTNINERHSTDPANNLTIELIEAGVGLPQPEVITLDDIKDNEDNFIFDPNQEFGCEFYQGRLVKINKVRFIDANSWGPNATLLITDDQKTFPIQLGRGWGFLPASNNLSETFDAIGIFDQEGGLKDKYRIWVLNYDGNGRVLTDRACARYNLPGDINRDGKVDMLDFAYLADSWLRCVPGTGACGGTKQ